MKREWILAAVVASGGAAAEPGAADPFTGGSAERGAAKAAVCVACHGPGGASVNPEWPKLAGQHATYTREQLRHYRTGARSNPLMAPQAAMLSDQDVLDLAAYFAAQAPAPGVASEAAVAAAGSLFRAGDPARGLPACAACHGPAGAGNAASAYPRISGQHATYTAKVLRDYRARAETTGQPSGVQMMAAVAAKLKDAEIDALASYVNGLQ